VAETEKAKRPDLGAVFDAHVRHEFVDHDVNATMETMSANPYVHNVPTVTGGYGHAGVVDFYTNHFVGKMPADTRVEQISRTVGEDRVEINLVLHSRLPHRFHAPGCATVWKESGATSRRGNEI
jgi:hypothetical protein